VTRTLPKTGATTLWPLASFVALAYAVSRGWSFPLVAAGDVVEKSVGWPTTFPALLGPALAAFVVAALVRGREAVRDLLARMRGEASILGPRRDAAAPPGLLPVDTVTRRSA
jgi:hypothetical protein